MTEYIQVQTTVDSRDAATRIARSLVEQRLAACVQILGPIGSTYRWQGEIQVEEEWLCLIKSPAARYPDVEAAIKALHPYQLPEIIALPVTAGSADYLTWLGRES